MRKQSTIDYVLTDQYANISEFEVKDDQLITDDFDQIVISFTNAIQEKLNMISSIDIDYGEINPDNQETSFNMICRGSGDHRNDCFFKLTVDNLRTRKQYDQLCSIASKIKF